MLIIKDDYDVARQVMLTNAVLMMMMLLLGHLFWDMEEVKEDMKCDKILDKGALCTFPISDNNQL